MDPESVITSSWNSFQNITHPEILSKLRLLLQNISEQFYTYNGTSFAFDLSSSLNLNLQAIKEKLPIPTIPNTNSFSTETETGPDSSSDPSSYGYGYDMGDLNFNLNLTNVISDYSDTFYEKLETFLATASLTGRELDFSNFSNFRNFGNFSLSPTDYFNDFLENHEDFNQHVITFSEYFMSLTCILLLMLIFNRLLLKSRLATEFLETVICILIFLPVFPPACVFFFGLILIRGVVNAHLKLFYPKGRFALMSPVDAFWSYEKYASCSACLGLYVIEGECDDKKIETIRERMQSTIDSDLVEGKMSKKLTSCFGFSCWETLGDEMDIDKHVEVVLRDSPNCGRKEVFAFMESIQDKPIVDMAPWKMYIVPKFSYGGKEEQKHYAVIFRLHHSIMDGISSANILHSVMADKPFKFSVDPVKPLGKESQNPSSLQTALLHLLAVISIPRALLVAVLSTDNFQNKYCLPGKQLTGPKRLDWSKPIDLSALKEVKNRTETSVYAVLLSCFGAALRQYYEKIGEKIECENFHVMSPVALLPYPDRKPKNRFTGIIVPTSVGGENLTTRRRLDINYKNIKEGSSSAMHMVVANWYFPPMLGILPLFMHGPLSSLLHLRMCLSNVPGPAEDVWIYGGGRISDVGVWLPIKYSLALGMGLFSYKDRVRATITADTAYFPNDSDFRILMAAFEQELEQLGQDVGLQDVFLKE